MGLALYSKYRSMSLKDIVGQDHVTDVLTRALKKGRTAHAYLLTGPRGIGKTSIARILAHEITGLKYDGAQYLDIIEIDAASNNGVDDIRELRDKARIAPVQSPKKVYIIDEVHMLSKPAFNALLKTLEEPPEHIVFILATTDVDKLPQTIISRTQRFNLRRISDADLASRLAQIAKLESIKVDDQAIELLASYGDGSFRDAINLLDQLSSLQTSGKIGADDVRQHLGIASDQLVADSLQAYLAADLESIVKIVNQVEVSGASIVLFARQILRSALAQVATNPQYINLLDGLVAVETSARPEVSLLVALSKNAQPKSNPVADKSTTDTKSASNNRPAAKAAEQAPSDATTAAKKLNSKPKSAAASVQPTKIYSTEVDLAKPEQDFPVKDLAAKIKPQSTGFADLLAKSDYYYNGSDLVIYCGSKFRQSKLDTTKFRSLFMEQVTNLKLTVDQLEISADKPPIKDPSLASVADLMGGGEMVDIT